jgi:hypothetical protein
VRGKDEGALLAGDAGAAFEDTGAELPFPELEELRSLVAEGRERGYLTFEAIAHCLEEVDVTKEQVQELHTYLLEHAIERR